MNLPGGPARRELSVRQDPVSGALAAECRAADPGLPLPRPLVVLVHGYNVDEAAARAGYGAIARRLERAGLPQWLADRTWQFYWPGNERNPLLSALSYPGKVKVAVRSAALLCDYLRRQGAPGGGPLEVLFIAHSLGCRVVAEVLCEFLRHGDRPYVPAAALMAGAVPVRYVEPGGRLAAGPRSAGRAAALFSGHDKVLRYCFPPGETAAGEGFLPQAVGLHGNPRELWTGGGLDTGLDHGGYWDDGRVAEFLVRCLGQAAARGLPQRTLPERGTPSYTPESAELEA